MKAIQKEVTYSTHEHEKDGEYSIKIKRTEKTVGNPKALMDSTIESEAIRMNSWEEGRKQQMRAFVLNGTIGSASETFWVGLDEDIPAIIPIPRPSPTPPTVERPPFEPPQGDAPLPKADEDMTLAELRAKYPKIKATSIAKFLDKVSHLPKNKK